MSEKKVKAEKKEAINWHIALDRAVLGERTELKTYPGYWVQPQRLTKAGEAEVQAIAAKRMAKQAGVRKQIIAEAGDSGMSEADRMAGVVPAAVQERILDAVIENLDGPTVGQLDSKIATIAYGVHAHNFESPDGGPASLLWAQELAGYADVFDEVLGIVEAKNRPL